MSLLYITEFTGLANPDSNFGAARMGGQLPLEPAIATQVIPIGGASSASAALNPKTTVVRLHSDVVCSIAFGVGSVTASNTSMRFAANQTEYFGVPKGDNYVVAVITNT